MKAWFGLNASLRALIKDWEVLTVAAMAVLETIGDSVTWSSLWFCSIFQSFCNCVAIETNNPLGQFSEHCLIKALLNP